MGSYVHSEMGGMKLRANRKVVEGRCTICGGGFTLGEEVAACPACGGYHHPACLGAAPSCTQLPAAAAQPATGWSAGPPSPGLIWTCPECGTANPQGSPCRNAANHRQTSPAASFPGPEEKRCPYCAEIIRMEAVKCRYCGTVLNPQAASYLTPTPQAGYYPTPYAYPAYSRPSPGTGIVETSMWSFSGRVSRSQFWLRGLAVAAILIVLIVIVVALADAGGDAMPVALILIVPCYIAASIFGLANQVKRWHDLDQSGWLSLLSFIPYLGIFVIIPLGFIKGTDGVNSRGEDPLGGGGGTFGSRTIT